MPFARSGALIARELSCAHDGGDFAKFAPPICSR
jgi:hypothetical protein